MAVQDNNRGSIIWKEIDMNMRIDEKLNKYINEITDIYDVMFTENEIDTLTDECKRKGYKVSGTADVFIIYDKNGSFECQLNKRGGKIKALFEIHFTKEFNVELPMRNIIVQVSEIINKIGR